VKFRAEEMVSILRKQIEEYGAALDIAEVGTIIELGDGIARVHGLSQVMAGEMVEFSNGTLGLALNLEEDSVGVALLGEYRELREGETVRRTGRVIQVPVGPALVGRVVDPVGNPLDGKGPISTELFRPVEGRAPEISERQPVKVPLQTGIKAVDAMTPVGRGQRELIIGDRKTGKTAIAIDAILNQKEESVYCVYVAVGQKESTVADVVATLASRGALDYTTVVVAGPAEPAALQYIAPYAGCAMAEYFMYEEGGATLCIYDDLSKQAASYRELSLLLRRPPGREAYPGDVFYLHSRLLERAAKLADAYIVVKKSAPADTPAGGDGKVHLRFAAADEAARQTLPAADELEVRKVPGSGGSMTALPIVETQEGEVSAYIPTNVISITDGQIYLLPDLFFAGVRPAVDVGISVSRVGGNAQIKAMKKVAGTLRLDLAQYRELEAFAQLGTELDAATERQLSRGRHLVELLKQPQYAPVHVLDQVVTIFAGTTGALDDLPLEEVRAFENDLARYVREARRELIDELAKTKELSAELAEKLKGAIADYKKIFAAEREKKKEKEEKEKEQEAAEESGAEMAAEKEGTKKAE